MELQTRYAMGLPTTRHIYTTGLSWYYGMGMPWARNGYAMGVPWVCHERAMGMRRPCRGATMCVRLRPRGHAMGTYAVGMTRDSLWLNIARLCHGCGNAIGMP